jgi:hypothetical protein
MRLPGFWHGARQGYILGNLVGGIAGAAFFTVEGRWWWVGAYGCLALLALLVWREGM